MCQLLLGAARRVQIILSQVFYSQVCFSIYFINELTGKYICRESKNFSKWLLKCTHCQYQGNVVKAYEHGKEHDKEMVSFRAIFDGSKRELATFRYTNDVKNMKDAILREFTPDTNMESDVECDDSSTSKSMENKVKPFQCPIKYCLFDGDNK